ncbi:MAG: transcription termination factor NusA [Patescibacteria group bacterium]
MFDLKNFTAAISQIAEEKGISAEKITESIESAIAAAYKKDYGKKGQIIKAKLNPETGEVNFWQIKIVVDKDMVFSEEELAEMAALEEGAAQPRASLAPSEREPRLAAVGRAAAGEISEDKEKIRFNPEKHIMLADAKKINSTPTPKGVGAPKPTSRSALRQDVGAESVGEIKVGEELETVLETKIDYGRIAAQTAKQVILQKIREAERESILGEFKSKEGQIVSGIVQRIEGRNIFFDIGKTLGVLVKEEQIPGEFYRPGQRLKVFIVKVEENPKGPLVFLSRAYPKLVSKLFELEVPEISAGSVVIKSLAREAGSRSKIAAATVMEGVDPIGSMVGQRGTRVMAVINELGGEKIDIIEWSEDPEKYIANSLSPAKVIEVKIMPKNKAQVVVPEDQLSLAIGKDGQNVRLAAKLTGWKIDVRGPGQPFDPSIHQGRPESLNGDAAPAKSEALSEERRPDEAGREDIKDESPEKAKEKKSARNASRPARSDAAASGEHGNTGGTKVRASLQADKNKTDNK